MVQRDANAKCGFERGRGCTAYDIHKCDEIQEWEERGFRAEGWDTGGGWV